MTDLEQRYWERYCPEPSAADIAGIEERKAEVLAAKIEAGPDYRMPDSDHRPSAAVYRARGNGAKRRGYSVSRD